MSLRYERGVDRADQFWRRLLLVVVVVTGFLITIILLTESLFT